MVDLLALRLSADRVRLSGYEFSSSLMLKAADELERLRREVEGLRAFKRSVDEALNSGNGSYRP